MEGFLSNALEGAWLVYDSTLPKRWERKELVQSLRRQGFSYREILQQIPFSLAKSTVSQWCKHIELTSEQLDRLDKLYRERYRNWLLGPKSTQRRRATEIEAIKAKARIEVAELQKNALWLTGLMLYWAEGNKTKVVGVSNSDARLVAFVMKWFRECCGIPEKKFKAYLHLHSGQDEMSMKTFWSHVTGLPLSQFGKSYVKKEGTGHRKNILYHGTIRISICDTNLLWKIRSWIESYCDTILGPLAQLVEQGALNATVAGSTPARPT